MTMAPPLSPGATLRWSIVRSILDDLRPRRVLEIGCGLGGFGARIARRAFYLGVEADERSTEVARSRIEPLGGRVVHGSADQVRDEGPFDLICAFEVIEHIEDDVEALTEWAGRVSPGGALLVSVPAWPERFGPWDELVGHWRRYTPEQLDGVLSQAGCVEVRHTLYGWPLGFALEAARVRIAPPRRQALADQTREARTAASGRTLQPGRLSGLVVQAAVAPFAVAQRLRPGAGTGLVGLGRR